jgi:hypothetical protein
MTFESISHENLISTLKKTNISELSDAECRELLEDMLAML